MKYDEIVKGNSDKILDLKEKPPFTEVVIGRQSAIDGASSSEAMVPVSVSAKYSSW